MILLNHPLMRAVCVAQALVLLTPAPSAHAASTKTITCDSREFERERCDIGNSGVRLKRQLSASSCREGRDWGYDKRGIWVDNGCEAEFEVSQESKFSGGEAAAAIIIGGLIFGAIAMGNDDDKKPPPATTAGAAPPHWALGGFRGRNPSTQRNEDLTVDKKGQIKVIRQGQVLLGQWIQGQQLSISNEIFRAERIGGGLRISNASGQSSDYFLMD